MLKKIVSAFMTVAMLMAITGCSSSPEEPQEEQKPQQEQTQEPKDSGILIAYFSKTGNTEEAAKEIQSLTDGTLVEIEPVDAYPDSYQETVDIAQEELESNARPEIKDINEDISAYDTIFVGYPIWWHDAPMAVYTFLEKYDFAGKTVIPFCTSGGSDIEESLTGIRNAVKDVEILEGLTANDSDDIEPWLQELGILN